MRLNITHINKIKKADIILNGLTVIAGNNDSGKSTVGKLLFSVIKSLSNADRLSSQSQDRIMRLNCAALYMYVKHTETESGEKNQRGDSAVYCCRFPERGGIFCE